MARALGTRFNPSAVDQCLQVPADRRLRKLHDVAQLRNRQLVTVEQQKQPAPCRARQCRGGIGGGWGPAVHSIRPSGLNDIYTAVSSRKQMAGLDGLDGREKGSAEALAERSAGRVGTKPRRL